MKDDMNEIIVEQDRREYYETGIDTKIYPDSTPQPCKLFLEEVKTSNPSTKCMGQPE